MAPHITAPPLVCVVWEQASLRGEGENGKKGRTLIACITVVLIRSANDVVGLDIHSVNVAEHSQIGNEASASTAAQSTNLQGMRG